MENEQKLLQLLERTEKTNRKLLIYTSVQTIFSVIAATLCIVLLLLGIKMLPQLQETVTQVQTIITNVETITDGFAESDLASLTSAVNSLVENMDGLVHITEGGVLDAIAKINEIDLEALNDAISDLSAVIEPLAKFFKTFKIG